MAWLLRFHTQHLEAGILEQLSIVVMPQPVLKEVFVIVLAPAMLLATRAVKLTVWPVAAR